MLLENVRFVHLKPKLFKHGENICLDYDYKKISIQKHPKEHLIKRKVTLT